MASNLVHSTVDPKGLKLAGVKAAYLVPRWVGRKADSMVGLWVGLKADSWVAHLAVPMAYQ